MKWSRAFLAGCVLSVSCLFLTPLPAQEATWVPIQGNIMLADGTPVCAMVLANGQYMFSCDGTGAYDLDVPLDANGQITLFSFADGLSPFSVTTGPGGFPFDVTMQRAAPGSPLISMTQSTGAAADNWVRISGEIESLDGVPLCAMVLANGQHMFTCGDALGRYDLTVPQDTNRQVTVFGFADSFQPYRQTFGVSTSTQPINDTGITWGGKYFTGNNTTCTGETIEQQDCSFGRDANPATNSDSDGHAGFSYTKINAIGDELPADATDWSCVKDNVTGLIWEKKMGVNGIIGDEGLHDADDRYTSYNTDPNTNGGFDGSSNSIGDCYGYNSTDPTTYCNTQAFVARVNAAGLCGATDWRMPGKMELIGLINHNRINPAIDVAYFPNTKSAEVLTSSRYAPNARYVWDVSFEHGVSGPGGGGYWSGINWVKGAHVRLVRSGH